MHEGPGVRAGAFVVPDAVRHARPWDEPAPGDRATPIGRSSALPGRVL